MKKGVILFIVIFISVGILFPVKVTSAENIKNERKEIIVKYNNDSELKTNKAVNTIKRKLAPQKMERRKLIKLDSSTLEIITIGKNDNPEYIAKELAKESGVEFAVKNNKIKMFPLNKKEAKDPLFKYQWGLNNTGQKIEGQIGKPGIDIDILKAWRITKGSPAVVVGVLDAGVDYNDTDLRRNIYVNKREIANNNIDDDKNGYIDDVNGWDFANDDNSVFDNTFYDIHGTHVAGIIAAESGNRIGISGVAPKVIILPLRFINDDGGYVSDAIEAIEYAQKKGVDIINCSWGLYEEDQALKYAMKKSNILFVCAAGNDGSDVSQLPTYPAYYNLPNIISVTSVNNQGKLSLFSNYGKGVNVAAPGENIMSTIPGNQYYYSSGTSMASPFVTGVAALIKSKRPSLTPYMIKKIIMKNVKKINGMKNSVDSGGIVDAYSVIRNLIKQKF